ncbi:MAG: ferritin [Synergistaceae bacterium]|nr:ferritin [Synergistaceae bacterium]
MSAMTPKMIESINDQIRAELESAYIYLSMSAYLEDQGLKGMAHWMRKQAGEEMEHAEKFMNYLYERGARVVLEAIAKPATDFDGPAGVFKEALKHEQYVSGRIYKMMDLALTEKDHMTASMLKWFIDEQVEEESSADEIVKKLEFLGGSNASVYLLDKELGQR